VKNNDGETKETEVELGLVSKDFAEIVSDNLKEGDIIWKGIGY
jgi:trehalose-6-phosphate synthase